MGWDACHINQGQSPKGLDQERKVSFCDAKVAKILGYSIGPGYP